MEFFILFFFVKKYFLALEYFWCDKKTCKRHCLKNLMNLESGWREGRKIYERYNVHSSALIWLLFLVDLIRNVMTCLNGIMTCKYLFKENSKTRKGKKSFAAFLEKAEKEKFPRCYFAQTKQISKVFM